MNEPPTNTDTPPTNGTSPQGWLAALTRLWLLRPLRSAPSGNPQRASLIMGVAWFLAWIAIDRWQSQPDPRFSSAGVPLLAWYVTAILALTALLRWRTRPEPEFG